MRGILHLQANREVFFGDGWFRSGDFGHFDEDGYLYVTDRVKDIISVRNSGGDIKYVSESFVSLNNITNTFLCFQVSPSKLEDAIYVLPEVARVAVVGIGRKPAEKVVAFVVRKAGKDVTVEDTKQLIIGKQSF